MESGIGAFHCGREINEEGEEKRKILDLHRIMEGGERKAKVCKGGWESTFTRSIITAECDRNMIKKRKFAKNAVQKPLNSVWRLA